MDQFVEGIRVVAMLAFMEGILSMDNAAIIGALAAKLPDQPIPLPSWMEWARRGLGSLGSQPAAALKVGLLGAYAGRGCMLVFAALIAENVVIKLIGAIYLVKLGMKHLSQADQPGEDAIMRRQKQSGFWATVASIEIMDLVFSLDNVIAAVAISPRIEVVMIGVGLGILVMRFAATIFIKLVKIEPRLTTAAYILVLQIGAELVVAEVWSLHLEDWEKFAISAVTILATFAYGRIRILRTLTKPTLIWFAQGLGNFNEIADWAIRPVTSPVRFVWGAIRIAKRKELAVVAVEFETKDTPD